MSNRPEETDKNWKWGLFYHNPEDPSLFVDKRVGIGQALNFAQRKAWLVILFFLFWPIIIGLALFIYFS